MIIILNLHSGTKLSDWLRHCRQLGLKGKISQEKDTHMFTTQTIIIIC